MAKIEKEHVHHTEYEQCMFDHVFIDVDSCLVGIEGIDELAKLHRCVQEVEALTTKAMNGDIAFDSVFEKRLDLIHPHQHDLLYVAQKYVQHITPDALTVIDRLKRSGATVWLISGGYDEAIYPLADTFGIDRFHVFANHLIFASDGTYLDFDRQNPLCGAMGKRIIIEALKKAHVIRGTVAIIGDGMSEVEAKGIVDMCIGFGGHVVRDAVKHNADVFIENKSFKAVESVLFM